MTTPKAATTDADGNRRYRIPTATGEIADLPNISSVLDVLQAWGLADWKLRMAAVGVAMSTDIAASITAHHHDEPGKVRNRALKAVIEDAIAVGQRLEPGRGYLANDFGSAIHLLTEHIDAGVVDIANLPTTVAEHAAHYVDLLAGHGIEVVHSEATVFNHAVGYAGTGDRIIRFAGTSPHLQVPDGFDHLDLDCGCFWLDIKTGSVNAKFAMQLAALANAEGVYDAETQTVMSLPADLRRDIGFALHLTAKGAALIPVELDKAWPAFCGGVAVKTFCDSKPLGQPLAVPTKPTEDDVPSVPVMDGAGAPSPEPAPSKPAKSARADFNEESALADIKRRWLIDRLKNLSDAGKQHAASFWSAQIPDVPTFKASPHHTMAELDAIEQVINAAERETRAPFPAEDPSKAEEPVANDDARRLAIVERLKVLPPDLLAAIEASNREHKVPRLTDSTAYLLPSHLDLVEGWVASAETEYAPRAQHVSELLSLLEEKGVDFAEGLSVVGASEFRRITEGDAEMLSDLVDAMGLGLVMFADGKWTVNENTVLAMFDTRHAFVAAAKAHAERLNVTKPTKTDHVLAMPALVAVVAMNAA